MQGPPKPRIYTEKRGGKTVTVISGLHTYGAQKLEEICRQLKTKLGCGGTVKDGKVEIQGEKAETVKAWFEGQKNSLKA